jgi:pimeloyl-ACP methyl ester carboxylesterase
MRFPLAVISSLVGLALTVCTASQKAAPQGYPPPGQLIEIGGRKLHLNCTGMGSPTVILVGGAGSFSIDWALVQPKVAQTTRVCSYDQAGFGWSDPGPADETVEQTIGDLHTLLRAAGEKGSYVLAGASIAGIYIQAYQRAYPNDVAALVFTNSSNRVGLQVKGGKVGLLWELTEEEIRSTFPPQPPFQRNPKPDHEGDPFDRLPPDLQAVRLWLDIRLWEKSDPAKATAELFLSWRKEFKKEFELTDAARQPLKNLPVVVVSSEPVTSDSEQRSHDGAAARLDFLSSNTAHITAKGSGHEIHLYQPDAVIQGLLRAVSSVRSGVPLPGR